MAAKPQEIQQQVQAFYEAMPFNYYTSTEDACRQLQSNPIAAMYPDLHALLDSGEVASVLDCGCGAGWLVNSIALHYKIDVTGLDMTGAALDRAREVAGELGVSHRTRFLQGNLLDYQDTARYDLVSSIGVLHHTHDAAAAFGQVQQFVAGSGFFYLGLYHLYGRRVFLDMFREVIEQRGEEAARELYCELDGARLSDTRHLESWFRDQVIHPHETQHTLEEVLEWFDQAGLELISTSINRFGACGDHAALVIQEKEYEALSHQANVVERRYFPGFFTALGQRCEADSSRCVSR